MHKEEVEKYIIDFKRQNKGLNDVKFKVFGSMEEAFPNLTKEDQEKHRFQGAYYPSKKVVAIITNEHENYVDLQKTLKHEVYGHHGINHLTREQKQQILHKIAEAPGDSTIGKFRDNLLNKGYGDLRGKPNMIAEEVYAHLAELLPMKKESFHGVPDVSKIESAKDLMNVIRSVKAGIQSGELEHKITPERDTLQFKTGKTISVNKQVEEKVHTNKSVLDFIKTQKYEKQMDKSREMER